MLGKRQSVGKQVLLSDTRSCVQSGGNNTKPARAKFTRGSSAPELSQAHPKFLPARKGNRVWDAWT